MSNQLSLELAVAAILIFSTLAGVWRGFLKTLYGMIKFALAIILAALLTPVIASCLPDTVIMQGAIGYIISFVVVNILLGVLDFALGLVDKIPILHQVNKALGGAVGLVRGLLIVWVGLFLIVTLTKSAWCVEAAHSITTSPFLAQLYEWDPIPAILKQMNFLM